MKKLIIAIAMAITLMSCGENPITTETKENDEYTLYSDLLDSTSDTSYINDTYSTTYEEVLDTTYESYIDSSVVKVSSNINDTTFIYVYKTYSDNKDHNYKKYYYIENINTDSITYYSTATDSLYTRTSTMCNVITFDEYNYYETGELQRIRLDIDRFYVYYDIDGEIIKVVEDGVEVFLTNVEVVAKIKEYEIESF